MSLPNLNLLNFELPQNSNCKYILTSPRSLKACRKAGIKPTDLLYKSLSEVEKELGSKQGALEKYEKCEKERQRKLAVCRKIRNDFLLRGFPISKAERGDFFNKHSPKTGTKTPTIDSNFEAKYGETSENIRITNAQNISKNIVKPSSLTSSHGDSKDDSFQTVHDDKRAISLHSSPIGLPDTPEKSTVPIRSSPALSSTKNSVTPTNKLCDNYNSSAINEKKNEENLEKLPFVQKLDLTENDLNYSNLINTENGRRKELIPSLDSLRKGLLFDDINNNYKLSEKKSSSSCRKRIREKKKLKALEYERLYQNICAQYADPQYPLFKYKQVIENSLERELREQEVHRVQRELEEGLEKWQDDVLLLQWIDSIRAQEQATKETEIKVQRLQRRSRSKNILHTMNYNKVKKDEDIKAELLRRLVEQKEKKIQELHKQRERVICESKTRAQSVSELKEQIRNILVPETFDKKVFKCGLQKKVLNTKAMCPRVMHSSHIRLA